MSARLVRKAWSAIEKKSIAKSQRRLTITTATTTRVVSSGLKPEQKNRTLSFVNHTGTEFMQLHGSTVVMASDDAVANPLTIVLVIMSIFLFMTLSVTVAIIVFCRKKNTVFVLQKCDQEDEISYELDEMNNTDIEFADFKGEHEAMIGKPRKSATCPDLAEYLEGNDPASLQRLLDTESETDDNCGQQRSPIRPKLKRRSNSFSLQNAGCYGYQKMIVTAVVEIESANKMDETCKNNFTASASDANCILDEDALDKRIPNRANIDKANNTEESVQNHWPLGQRSIAHASTCFNRAKLAFLDFDSDGNSCHSNIGLPSVEKMHINTVPDIFDQNQLMEFKTDQNKNNHFYETSDNCELHQLDYFNPSENEMPNAETESNCLQIFPQKLEPNASESTEMDTLLNERDTTETELSDNDQSTFPMQTTLDQSNLRAEDRSHSNNQSKHCFQNHKIFQNVKSGSVKKKHYSVPACVSDLTNHTESNKHFDEAVNESETLLQTAVEIKSKDLDQVSDTTGLFE